MMTDLATMLRDRLGLAEPAPVEIRRGDVQEFDGFFRERIEYRGLEGDLIPALLFTPKGRETLGGVVVFHQHNGEFHFGKSEVAGEVGIRSKLSGLRLPVEASWFWRRIPSLSRIGAERFRA